MVRQSLRKSGSGSDPLDRPALPSVVLCLSPPVADFPCLALSPPLQVSLPFNPLVCFWICLYLCHFVQWVFLDASVIFLLIYLFRDISFS